MYKYNPLTKCLETIKTKDAPIQRRDKERRAQGFKSALERNNEAEDKQMLKDIDSATKNLNNVIGKVKKDVEKAYDSRQFDIFYKQIGDAMKKCRQVMTKYMWNKKSSAYVNFVHLAQGLNDEILNYINKKQNAFLREKYRNE